MRIGTLLSLFLESLKAAQDCEKWAILAEGKGTPDLKERVSDMLFHLREAREYDALPLEEIDGLIQTTVDLERQAAERPRQLRLGEGVDPEVLEAA